MIISNCPRCREGFRVPSGAIPQDALAQCPWCQETFPIAEVLGDLPPMLQLLAVDGAPLNLEQANDDLGSGLRVIGEVRPSAGESSAHDSSAHEASRNRDAVGPGWSAVTEPMPQGTFGAEAFSRQDHYATVNVVRSNETIVDDSWTNVDIGVAPESGDELGSHDDPYRSVQISNASLEAMKMASGSARRKRKGSGFGTLIGIVLGGLASVPIAGFVLMMLGRTPDWGFYPFQGQQSSGTTITAAPLPETSSSLPTGESSPGTLRFDRGSDDHSRSLSAAASSESEIVTATLSDQQPRVGERETITEQPIESDRTTQANVDARAASSNIQQATVTTGSTTDSPEVREGSSSRSALASAEGEKLASDAEKMIEIVSEYQGDPIERRRRIGLTYSKIASAVEAELSEEVLASLAAKIVSAPLRNEMQIAGWAWLGASKRSSDGIALIGVTEVSEKGTFLNSESGGTIALVSDAPLEDGQPVLVLGRLADQGKSMLVAHVEPIPQPD